MCPAEMGAPERLVAAQELEDDAFEIGFPLDLRPVSAVGEHMQFDIG